MQDFFIGQNAARPSDVRFIGALMGRYLLASRRHKVECVQVFACRLQSISPQTLVASAPVPGVPGEDIAASFEPFGLVHGKVERLVEGGFWVAIEADDPQRSLLARRIAWYKKKTFDGLADKRHHKRVMPRDARSLLVFADGSTMECLIIDMSRSGAAVSADVQPAIGTPLAVGTVVGRVVRWLEVGFAVRFTTEQDAQALEDRLHPPG
jgi:hypothetical protein